MSAVAGALPHTCLPREDHAPLWSVAAPSALHRWLRTACHQGTVWLCAAAWLLWASVSPFLPELRVTGA